MTSGQLPQPSKSELDLLKILWRDGESTVRGVHDKISERHDWAYSTSRTILDRLVSKGLVKRREFHGLFLYEAVISKPMGLASRVRDFADRVLELDYASVVALFARSDALTPEEIEELSQLLEASEDDDA